jgi:nicotinate-nucleotide adenylyltransferase
MSETTVNTPSSGDMLAIFGGTFDPVHIGHLQPVSEASKELGLQQVRLLPCHIPPHKQTPHSSPKHRLAMLELACQQWPLFVVDDRELRWNQTSYSVDTLRDFRAEFGNHRPLVFFIGMDSLCNLDCWHEWQSLFDYCHLVVCRRGDILPDFNVNIASLVSQRQTDDPEALKRQACGLIYLAKTSLITVSSTAVRAALSQGNINPAWLPAGVLDYIQQHQLYQKRA